MMGSAVAQPGGAARRLDQLQPVSHTVRRDFSNDPEKERVSAHTTAARAQQADLGAAGRLANIAALAVRPAEGPARHLARARRVRVPGGVLVLAPRATAASSAAAGTVPRARHQRSPAPAGAAGAQCRRRVPA